VEYVKLCIIYTIKSLKKVVYDVVEREAGEI